MTLNLSLNALEDTERVRYRYSDLLFKIYQNMQLACVVKVADTGSVVPGQLNGNTPKHHAADGEHQPVYTNTLSRAEYCLF
jgi:hypothetical protein